MDDKTVEQQTDDPQPKAGGESASGKTDLDTLLTEFDTAAPKEPAKQPPPPARAEPGLGQALKAMKPVIDYVEDKRREDVAKAQQADLDAAFDYMLEPEEFKEFPKRWLIGYFESYGAENSGFADAFEKRHESPGNWTSALEKARKAFPEWIKELPGNTVRSDVEAAAAAVNGTTQEAVPDPDAPSPVQKASMSDVEWKRYMQEQERISAAG